jgi:lipopolysaccharide/colanic/teichoic acid biosynthesis glycosyltransferase
MASTPMEPRSARPDPSPLAADVAARPKRTALASGSRALRMAQRGADVGLGLFLLPSLIVACGVILLLNMRWNPGPLFFVRTRMGQHGRHFSSIEFRSMRPSTERARGYDTPAETERVTPLGYWLRRTRLDELPHVLNVLAGQMSFLGPPPDSRERA